MYSVFRWTCIQIHSTQMKMYIKILDQAPMGRNHLALSAVQWSPREKELADCLLWYFLCYTPYHTCFCDLSNSSYFVTLASCLTGCRLHVDSERWDVEVRLLTFNSRKSGLTCTVVIELSELCWKIRGHHPANYHRCGDSLERTNLKIRNLEGRSSFYSKPPFKNGQLDELFLFFSFFLRSSLLVSSWILLLLSMPHPQGKADQASHWPANQCLLQTEWENEKTPNLGISKQSWRYPLLGWCRIEMLISPQEIGHSETTRQR